MANEREIIDITDSPELRMLADQIQRLNEPRILRENDEDIALIVPVSHTARVMGRARSGEDHNAFLSSVGGWRDLVDTDQLKAEIAESRRRSKRPPIEL